jgi:hypothetical protein
VVEHLPKLSKHKALSLNPSTEIIMMMIIKQTKSM